MARLRLVIRGDDAGSCSEANRAILEACGPGILRNVSIMVPGPAFDEAAALFAGRPEICLGLHVTLNAEWDTVRWRPLLPAAQVSSLVEADGSFTASPMVLYERRANVDEMMAEVEAQLAHARAAGLHISYLDEHMGVGWLPGLRERLAALAAREGLVDASSVPPLPAVEPADPDPARRWIAQVLAAPPGTYVLIAHPGYDDGLMHCFATATMPVGRVARERDQERRALLSPCLQNAFQDNGVTCIRYDALQSNA